MRIIRILQVFPAFVVATFSLYASESKFDPSLLKNGDILFQTSKSDQSKAIQIATKSPYSHCGIVHIQKGKIFVFEASTKVKHTKLSRFLAKGEGGKFVVKRLAKSDSLLTDENLAKLKTAGKRFEGLPYDAYFDWGDDRIYCSELVFKIYHDGLNIALGTKQTLKDLDLSHPAVQAKLKERYGDKIPWNESVVSPASQFDDPDLIEVYNNYGSS